MSVSVAGRLSGPQFIASRILIGGDGRKRDVVVTDDQCGANCGDS